MNYPEIPDNSKVRIDMPLKYFERIEKKLEVATSFINNLRDYAIRSNKPNLLKSIDRCLQEIKKI